MIFLVVLFVMGVGAMRLAIDDGVDVRKHLVRLTCFLRKTNLNQRSQQDGEAHVYGVDLTSVKEATEVRFEDAAKPSILIVHHSDGGSTTYSCPTMQVRSFVKDCSAIS
jgi:hypothetical protein